MINQCEDPDRRYLAVQNDVRSVLAALGAKPDALTGAISAPSASTLAVKLKEAMIKN